MNKNKTHLICFDMDGVLISSMRIANRIFFDIVKRDLGLNAEPFKSDPKNLSISAKERFDMFWKDEIEEKGITQEQIDKALEDYRKEKLGVHLPLLPGAKEAVELIAEHFENIACVSSNADYVVEQELKQLGIGNYFKKITGTDGVKHSKPNPEIYEITAKFFKIAPKNSLVFEDSTNGVISAKGAGMKVVGVTTGLEGHDELKSAGADTVLPDLTEVTLEMVNDLLNIE